VLEKHGGFDVEVRAVAGSIWPVRGVAAWNTIGELKARLLSVDTRFRTHRTELVLGSTVLGDAETLGECQVGPGTRFLVVFSDLRAAVLVIGGGVAGYRAIEELSSRMLDRRIILADAREYSEFAPGILRAYADPAAWESLAVRHEDALSNYPNVEFVQGECLRLRPNSATFGACEDNTEFTIRYDYCVVATGCAWAPRDVTTTESLWKPSSLGDMRKSSAWPTLDERSAVGRRRHIVEEHSKLWKVHDKGGCVLVVGADYCGVEWACDLAHYFPGLHVTMVDQLPRCLVLLPQDASDYAERYMQAHGISTYYGVAYEPDCQEFWDQVGLPDRADITYILTGISPTSKFMPPGTLSSRGPGGGGWIVTNPQLQVCLRLKDDRPAEAWGGGCVFAIGDCHYGAVLASKKRKCVDAEDITDAFAIPPIPKTVFAATCWAREASRNILSKMVGFPLNEATWPHEAGIIAVSLGPLDGVVVQNIDWQANSGQVILTGEAAAKMKSCLSWPEDPQLLTSSSQWLAAFQENLRSCRRLPGAR